MSVTSDDIRRAIATLGAEGDLLLLESAADADADPPVDLSQVVLDVIRDLVARRAGYDASQASHAVRKPIPSANSLDPYPEGWTVVNRSISTCSVVHNGA